MSLTDDFPFVWDKNKHEAERAPEAKKTLMGCPKCGGTLFANVNSIIKIEEGHTVTYGSTAPQPVCMKCQTLIPVEALVDARAAASDKAFKAVKGNPQ